VITPLLVSLDWCADAFLDSDQIAVLHPEHEHAEVVHPSALMDCEGRLARNELVNVPVWSPEVLSRRSWFTRLQPFSARPQRGQIADSETDNRAGGEMLLARIAATETLDMPPIRKLEDPEIRFRIHLPETENTLVEMRKFTVAAGSSSAPSKARDLHSCQYHRARQCAPVSPRAHP
jgi:hypothetical protein